MKYVNDHDYHIHSLYSPCGGDPLQTPERILQYAKDYNLKQICLADHFWDEKVPHVAPDTSWGRWCKRQDFQKISQALPLPSDDNIRFMFGCETDIDKLNRIGVSKERLDLFDFIVVSTTHLHMNHFTIDDGVTSLERRADIFVEKFDALLNMDLPFKKIGLAHITCGLVAVENTGYLKVFEMIKDETYQRLFSKAAELGMGIELNLETRIKNPADRDCILRPYFIAKACGCKFYLGSDAHTTAELERAYERQSATIETFGLEESDKFII